MDNNGLCVAKVGGPKVDTDLTIARDMPNDQSNEGGKLLAAVITG
jgi:hypothetical protein